MLFGNKAMLLLLLPATAVVLLLLSMPLLLPAGRQAS
jgi:hypothetical protein